MAQLLDQIEEKKPKATKLFSILSFSLGLINLNLILVMVNTSSKYIRASEVSNDDSTFLTQLLIISVLLALIFTIASLIRREPKSWFKVIGAILNLLLFVLLLGLMFSALVI